MAGHDMQLCLSFVPRVAFHLFQCDAMMMMPSPDNTNTHKEQQIVIPKVLYTTAVLYIAAKLKQFTVVSLVLCF